MRSLFALLAALVVASCADHLVSEGEWRLAGDGVAASDPCGLLPASGPWIEGSLRVIGDRLRFDLGPSGLGPGVAMSGQFKRGTFSEQEAFLLEGTLAGAAVAVAGASCTVRLGHLEIDGTVAEARRFGGGLRLDYSLEGSLDPACPTRCVAEAGYQALWAGNLP